MLSDAPPQRGSQRIVLWSFLAGCALAVLLSALQATAVGGWAGLLSVGDRSPLRVPIEAELGSVPTIAGSGHDGQATYVMALDLDGDEFGSGFDDAGYRYRRILYPLIASAFGWLDGEALLASMISLQVASFGLAVASIVSIAASLRLPRWVVVGVLLNPGAWLGIWLLTPDVPALGLSALAVALAASGRWWPSAAAMGAAGLTKEVYLVMALSLALVAVEKLDARRAIAYLSVSAAPLAVWVWALTDRFGTAVSPRGNLTWPFLGIVRSISSWDTVAGRDLALGSIALSATLALAFVVTRVGWSPFRAMAVPWLVLAIASSTWVWDFGNNALRVLSPVVALAVVGSALVMAGTPAEHLPGPGARPRRWSGGGLLRTRRGGRPEERE